MNDNQIKDMMALVLEFYKCSKHANIRGMADVCKEASDYLRNNNLTPDDFKKFVEDMSGQPIPKDDLFFNGLLNQFKE